MSVNATFARTLALGAALACASLAHAAPKDDAQALLQAALVEIKAKGLEPAAASITNTPAPWTKGSSYVFVADLKDATILAHAVNPKVVGKSLIEAKDPSGKAFVKEQVELIRKDGHGAVAMRWVNPTTKQIADAEALVARVPGADAYVGAVYFK